MAVKSDGAESAEVVAAGVGPAGPPGSGGGSGSPRPNGDPRPSELNVSSKSNRPSRPVLSTIVRPSWFCRRRTIASKRVAPALIVMPAGPIIIMMAPRGGGLFGSNGLPPRPGGGKGGVLAVDAGSHGPGSV